MKKMQTELKRVIIEKSMPMTMIDDDERLIEARPNYTIYWNEEIDIIQWPIIEMICPLWPINEEMYIINMEYVANEGVSRRSMKKMKMKLSMAAKAVNMIIQLEDMSSLKPMSLK